MKLVLKILLIVSIIGIGITYLVRSYSIYALPLWVIFLLLTAGCVLLIRFRNDSYFRNIKNIMGSKKTNEAELYTAIDEINNKSKGTFSIIDYVDVKLHGNAYKLFKGTFASIFPAGEYGFLGKAFSSNYICSLDEVSLANAMGMTDLLTLSVQNGNTAIFSIKNIRSLKKEIEKEALLIRTQETRSSVR